MEFGPKFVQGYDFLISKCKLQLFMHTLDMSLVNSWVMYRSNMREKGEISKETNVVC